MGEKKRQKYYECLQGGLEWMKNVWSCSSAKSSESAHALFFDFWVWLDPNHKEKRKQRWSRHRERSFWNLALKCKSSQSLEQSQSAYTLWNNLKGLENHCMVPSDARGVLLVSFPQELLKSCMTSEKLSPSSSFTAASLKTTWENYRKCECSVQFCSSASALYSVVFIWRYDTSSISLPHFYSQE